jgi:hypothetical protein
VVAVTSSSVDSRMWEMVSPSLPLAIRVRIAWSQSRGERSSRREGAVQLMVT